MYLYWSQPKYTAIYTVCFCECVLYPEFWTDVIVINEWGMCGWLSLPHSLHKASAKKGQILYSAKQNIIYMVT